MATTVELDDYVREIKDFGVLSHQEILSQLNRLSPYMLDIILNHYDYTEQMINYIPEKKWEDEND